MDRWPFKQMQTDQGVWGLPYSYIHMYEWMNVVGALLFARLFPTATADYVSQLKEKPKNSSLVCFSSSQRFRVCGKTWAQFGQASIMRPDNEDEDDADADADDGAR